MSGPGSAGPRHQEGRILLYDGLCPFCDRVVRFVARRDRSAAIHFAALQGEFAREVLSRHAGLKGVDSLVLIVVRGSRDETVLTRSDAAIELGRALGGVWRVAAVVARGVPRRLRDLLYDAFARRRYRVFGRYDVCRAHPPLPQRKGSPPASTD